MEQSSPLDGRGAPYHPALLERELLRLAARGMDIPLVPSDSEFESVVSKLAERRLVVLFTWFWRHADVARFNERCLPSIEAADVAHYIEQLVRVLATRQPVHWIERVNLFHVYGLTRLFTRDTGIGLLNRMHRSSISVVRSMTDLSAYNASQLLREASANDSLPLFDGIADPRLLADYGLYQIYYYHGLQNMIETLSKYVQTPKQAIIPQSVAGIFKAQPHTLIMSKSIRDRIYSEVLLQLPKRVVTKLEAIEKGC